MKPLAAAVLAAFLLSGCTTLSENYNKYAKPYIGKYVDKAKSALENVDIQPTPERRPEDDRG